MFELNGKLSGLSAYQPVDAANRVRMDANESFLPLPEELVKAGQAALESLEFNRYPDPVAGGLCRAFAGYYGVDPSHVVAGNGSDELISVIFQGFLMKGEAFATIEPDFSMYAQAGALAEGRQVRIGKKGYRINIDEVAEACAREDVKLLVFSNPCNPTSIVLGREEVRRLVRSVRGLVVLDEAYMDFSTESLLGEECQYDNLIILRTCSKAMGMAALRLGFAVAAPRLADALRAAKSPYNVNSLSQAIGTAAMADHKLLQDALAAVLASKGELMAGLEEIAARMAGRFALLPSGTNFAALDMPEARAVQEKLLERGVAVRYTGGLLRVSCGYPEENKRFLNEFREILEELA